MSQGDDDRPVLADVYRREYPRLVGLLALRVRDQAVAEELAQDALVELCRRWPDIDDPGRWLTRVALNLSNSWLRRKVAERRAMRRHGAPPDVTNDVVDPDRDRVRDAVAALSRKEQQVIVLRFYEGLSVIEAAELLGWPEGTVKSLSHRGLKRLARRLQLAPDEVVFHA